MPKVSASTLEQAETFIKSGTHRKIVLNFNISGDEFFKLAVIGTERNGKILRDGEHFMISMKKVTIPPND